MSWLSDFYASNNIGGPGGKLDGGAIAYWEGEKDRLGGGTAGENAVKDIIRGTAINQGTWQMTSASNPGGNTGAGNTTNANANNTVSSTDFGSMLDNLTIEGSALQGGLSGLTTLANTFDKNCDIRGNVVGKLGDIFTTQATKGIMLNYEKDLANATYEIDSKKMDRETEEALELGAAEHGWKKDEYAALGAQDRLTIGKTGEETRLNIGAEGAQDRLNIGAQKDADIATIGETGKQQRLGIMETGEQQRMNIGAEGTQDRLNIAATGREQRLGIKETGQQTRLTRMTEGDEKRKTMKEDYRQQKGMRADARGAISSAGARFFG